MRNLLSTRKRLRPGALMHVTLQARIEDRMSGQAVRDDLKKAGCGKELILANVKRLRKLVHSLEWAHDRDGWSEYTSCAHMGRDRAGTAAFLQTILNRIHAAQVLDLGANDGHFSERAAHFAALAVAVDSDEPVLDELHHRSREPSLAVVFVGPHQPITVTGLGELGATWSLRAGAPRSGRRLRSRPSSHLHRQHLPAGDPIRSFNCVVALQFVAPDDEMVSVLTANKHADKMHPGREESEFRGLLTEVFDIRSEQVLDSRTRVLFELMLRGR